VAEKLTKMAKRARRQARCERMARDAGVSLEDWRYLRRTEAQLSKRAAKSPLTVAGSVWIYPARPVLLPAPDPDGVIRLRHGRVK
jgi:hypothetical protein